MYKVAVVTGGNKGIGFAIVERLARELNGWKVYLTARNVELGQASVQRLAEKGVSVNFHQLDITSERSVDSFATYAKNTYGGLDILVNNAGIAYKNDSAAPVAEQAEVTVNTNFFGTLNVCNALFPLLKPHARVVNMSSQIALDRAWSQMSKKMQEKFSTAMTMDELTSAMKGYINSAKNGCQIEDGWPTTCYGTSLVGVTAMTKIQQRVISMDTRKDLIVNASCPGYVATDMSSHKGHSTPEEASDTPCYLATLPTDVESPKGELVRDRKIQSWP